MTIETLRILIRSPPPSTVVDLLIFFSFVYVHTSGLAFGAPLSATVSEISGVLKVNPGDFG